MVLLYILELETGKYYIGKTYRDIVRINEHFDGQGSEWTKKYKPIKIVETIADCDDYDEDKYTIKYMAEKGIDNVRGGSFCTIHLSRPDKIILERMILSSKNCCFKCKKSGHFARECSMTSVDTEQNMWNISLYFNWIWDCIWNWRFKKTNVQTNVQTNRPAIPRQVNTQICYRCQKSGHIASHCTSTHGIDGELLPARLTCYRCNQPGHFARECTNT